MLISLTVLNHVLAEMMARLIESPCANPILFPYRSAKLNWPPIESILRDRPMKPRIDEQTLVVAQRDYEQLSMETAQRTIRF